MVRPVHRVLAFGGQGAALLSVLAGLYGPTQAATEPAIQFIEEAPVVFTIKDGGIEPNVEVVAVVVTGLPDATAALEVTGEPAPWVSIEPSGYTTPSNGRLEFQVSIAAEAQAAEGVLVATSSDGALARRALTIATPGTAAAPLPSTLTFNGWHWVPFVRVDARIQVKSDSAFAGHEDGPVGVVSSGNGDTANVVLSGEDLSIDGVKLAGGYAGKADFTPDIEDDAVQITVNVRDFWIWPLALLITGLLLVTMQTRFKTMGAPGQGLRIRLRMMKEEIQQRYESALQALRNAYSDADLPRAISQDTRQILLFDSLEQGATTSWLTAFDQADRDAWRSDGASFTRIKQLRDSYVSLLQSISVLGPLHREILIYCDTLDVRNEADESLTVGLLVQLLWADDIADESDLQRMASQVDQMKKPLPFLSQALMYLAREEEGADDARREQLRRFAQRLLRRDLEGLLDQALINEWRATLDQTQPQPPAASVGDATVRSLDDLLSRWSQPGSASPPVVAAYAVDPFVAQEVAAKAGPIYLIDGADPEYAVAADSESAELLQLADIGQVRPADVDPNKPVLVVASTPQTNEKYAMVNMTGSNVPPEQIGVSLPGASTEELLAKFRSTEASFSFLAAVFTILGGMATLYFPSPTFGSLGDYAGVVLWGTAFGKGADAVAKFLASR
jgi:hypothetical protein